MTNSGKKRYMPPAIAVVETSLPIGVMIGSNDIYGGGESDYVETD